MLLIMYAIMTITTTTTTMLQPARDFTTQQKSYGCLAEGGSEAGEVVAVARMASRRARRGSCKAGGSGLLCNCNRALQGDTAQRASGCNVTCCCSWRRCCSVALSAMDDSSAVMLEVT